MNRNKGDWQFTLAGCLVAGLFLLACSSTLADEGGAHEGGAGASMRPGAGAPPDRDDLEPGPFVRQPAAMPAGDEPAASVEQDNGAPESFLLLDEEVAPGSRRRLAWYASETSAGLAEATPVLVAHGAAPGPVLCLSAAVHGDELNGIEIVRNLLYDLKPERLNGTVIGVPIVNLHGFRLGSRYLSDRRDLNRYFPGDAAGSSAARIAHSFFHSVIKHCDYLVDLHTGSFQRTNLPQLRADLGNEKILELTKGFGATVVLHGQGPEGSLRAAASAAGIPAVVIEAGEPLRVQRDEVAHGIRALRSLLNHLGMVSRFSLWGEPQPVYYESSWVRAESDGILTSKVDLGAHVSEGELLGRVTDPITNIGTDIRSPHDGRVLGMSLNQIMRPGYAAYHIGIRRSDSELVEEVPPEPETEPEATEPRHEADTGQGRRQPDTGA